MAEESQGTIDKNRLIPPFDTTATEPADIYPLHDIIPEAEWKALSVSAFDTAQTDKERIAILAFRKSTWLNDHLKALVGVSGKSKKKNMCGIYLFSVSVAFLRWCRKKNPALYLRYARVPTGYFYQVSGQRKTLRKIWSDP